MSQMKIDQIAETARKWHQNTSIFPNHINSLQYNKKNSVD